MTVDFRLEVIVVPVADVDRAKGFYADQMGFDVDHDTEPNPGIRVVQLTPPGSACSIVVGKGVSPVAPGSSQGLHLVVTDIEATRAALVDRGVDVGELFHFGAEGQTPGPDPERSDYGTFAAFSDPDGNGWLLQEVPSRAAGA
jgi:catechol 2,3-dioxygenase-like lactoylglutathione lyase family enzyme